MLKFSQCVYLRRVNFYHWKLSNFSHYKFYAVDTGRRLKCYEYDLVQIETCSEILYGLIDNIMNTFTAMS